jgi:predicted RNase H-like HicB family nuclease
VPVHVGEHIGPGLIRRIERDLERVSEGMVEEVKSYHVTYERDESGWWVASVRGLRGCHTQGRTVDEARRRIVEAMELFVDNTRSVDYVKLPASAKKAIRAYATLRKKAEQQDRRAALHLAEHQRERVEALRRAGATAWSGRLRRRGLRTRSAKPDDGIFLKLLNIDHRGDRKEI